MDIEILQRRSESKFDLLQEQKADIAIDMYVHLLKLTSAVNVFYLCGYGKAIICQKERCQVYTTFPNITDFDKKIEDANSFLNICGFIMFADSHNTEF